MRTASFTARNMDRYFFGIPSFSGEKSDLDFAGVDREASQEEMGEVWINLGKKGDILAAMLLRDYG